MSLEDRVKALEERVAALERAAADTKVAAPGSRPIGRSPATPKETPRPAPGPRVTPGTKYMSPAPKTGARPTTGTTPKAGIQARVGAKLATPSRGGAKPHTASELYNVFAHSIPVGWKPAAAKEFKAEAKVPPEAELNLHHIYGFSSKICQSNVYFIGPEEIIYSAAATVVVHNLATNKQHFLVGHTEDITSLTLDSTRTYVATGQRDPKGGGQNIPFTCVWDIKTGKLLTKISFHERAVAALCFSPDGKYLVTFGDGELKVGAVWDWRAESKKKDIARAPLAKFSVAKEKILGAYSAAETEESKNGEFHFVTVGEKQTIFWKVSPTLKDKVARSIASTFNATKTIQKFYYCVAHLGAGSIAVGTASGHVYVFKNEKLNKAIAVSAKSVTGIATVPEGFVTASNDGVLRRYNNECKAVAEFSDFPGGAKPLFQSLDFKDGKLVVGTRDSGIFILDLDFSKLSQPVTGHRDEVCFVAVNPAQTHVASASKDAGIRIWDYSNHTLVHKITLKKPVFSIAYSHDGKHLAYGLQDGSVGLLVDGKVTTEAKVGAQQMNGMQFTPGDKEIVCGSDDNNLYILEAASLRLKFKLTGHTSAITHVSISNDGKFAVTNSRDYAICYWDVAKGKRLLEIGNDVVWEEWTGIYGWPVMGIWDAAGDGSDVNTATISGKPETWSSPTESKSEVVITGDDNGQVNLYAYPVLAKKNAGVHSYLGHSSHVPCVRLSPGDRFVFSAGGHDLTMFQWKLRKAGHESSEPQNGTKGDAPAGDDGAPASGEAGDGAEAQAEATEEAPAAEGDEAQQEEQPAAEDGGEQQAEAAEEQPQEE